MILQFLDLRLESIKKKDLEFLRILRNNNRKVLKDTREISFEEQINWFNNLDLQKRKYLLISRGGKKVGFIYAKIIKLGESLETGILIAEEYKSSSSVVLAALMMSYHFLINLKFDKLQALVHKENKEALLFNSQLGFIEASREKQFVFLQMDLENFKRKNAKLLEKLDLEKNLRVQVG